MSEIKGQILGIILVLTIFVTVGGMLGISFKNAANTVSSEIDQTVVVKDSI